LYVFRRNFS